MKKILSLLVALLLVCTGLVATGSEYGTLIKTGSSWQYSATSENANTIDKAFDSDLGSYWHTQFSFVDGNAVGVDGEISFTVDFGEEMEISGWRYTPRSDNGTGTFLNYTVYKSMDGTTFEKIYNGEFDYLPGADTVREPKSASWGNQKMKYIKIEVTKALSGAFGTAAEVQFYTDGKGSTNASGVKSDSSSASSSTSTSSGSDGTLLKTDSSWQYSATSENANTIDKAFDADLGSYWHTKFSFVDGEVVGVDGEISFTVDFGKEMEISGWRYTPRSDNGTGTFLNYTVYKSMDGKTFEKIYNGTFDYQPGADTVREPKSASWGNQKMKFIKIEVTKALSGAFGSAAEVQFYTGGKGSTNASGIKEETKKDESKGRTSSDGTALYKKSGWKAEVNSAMGGSPVTNILDDNTGTYWHSIFKAQGTEIISHDNPPYHLYITLPEAVLTSGIMLTPRQDNATGRILEVNIYVTDSDNGEWFLLKDRMEFDKSETPKEIPFSANLKIKKIWVEVLRSNSGFGTLAEFDLMEEKKDAGTISYEEFAAYDAEHTYYEISRDEMKAEYDGANWGDNAPARMMDGATKTFWQTDGLGADGFPAVLTVDLGRVYRIKEIRYLPRQTDDCHGAWLDVTISGSRDNANYSILKEAKFEKNTLLKAITFDEEAEVRYLEFQINEAFASRVSCAELTFWQTKAGRDFAEASEKETYVLKIGSPTIESEEVGVKSTKTLDVAPYIVNGSTMIPLRGLLEEMGAEVLWNGDDKTVTVNSGNNVITLQIWNYLVYVTGTKYGDVRYTLLNPPIIKDSRTFIPIRFVSEQLGYNVSWDGETQTVTITK